MPNEVLKLNVLHHCSMRLQVMSYALQLIRETALINTCRNMKQPQLEETY